MATFGYARVSSADQNEDRQMIKGGLNYSVNSNILPAK